MTKEEELKEVLYIKRNLFTGHPPKDPSEILAELRKMFGGKAGDARSRRGGRDRMESGGHDRSEG